MLSGLQELENLGIHDIELEAEVAEPALLVLSEVYYPAGWKAYVDGVETEILKTNYIMRSVAIEPGKHEIRFVFEPVRFTIGLWVTFGTLGSMVLLAFFGWRASRTRTQVKDVALAA